MSMFYACYILFYAYYILSLHYWSSLENTFSKSYRTVYRVSQTFARTNSDFANPERLFVKFQLTRTNVPFEINRLNCRQLAQYEESGTCDEEGNVEITKTFIEQIRDKKMAGRVDKRSNAMNSRTQRSTEPPIQKGRPIKAASFDSSRSLENPKDQYTVEQCQSRSSVCSNCLLVERARKKCKAKADLGETSDVNENLRYSLDHSAPQDRLFKNCVQLDESKMIVSATGPYLSSHLSRGKRSRNPKWNGLQRRSNEISGSVQNFSRNLTNVPYDLANNCRAEYSCHCQGSFNSPRLSFNDFQSVNCWDLTGSLVESFSRGLNITNENDGKNCVNQEQTVYNSEHVPVENSVRHLSNHNFLHPHPWNEANRQLASYQYNSCCQNFATNAAEQSNRMDYVQYPNQSLMYSLQNVRELPCRGYFHQQFSSNDVKPTAIGSYPPEFLPTENYYREQPNVSMSVMPNRTANDYKYLNHHQMIGNSLLRNYDSLLNTTLNFDERFAYENRMNPMSSMKDTTFAENKMQFEEKFRKL